MKLGSLAVLKVLNLWDLKRLVKTDYVWWVVVVVCATFLIALGIGVWYCTRNGAHLQNVIKLGAFTYKIVCSKK